MSEESLTRIFESTCRKLEAEGLIDRLPPEAQEWWKKHKELLARIKAAAAQVRQSKKPD